jgi:putative heme-binding domain-containing protein
LENDTALPMPDGWPPLAFQLRYHGLPPEAAKDLRELSALFGDKDVLLDAQMLLADRTADIEARREALSLLKRADDLDARPVYLVLLNDPDFRRVAVQRLARFGHPSAAEAMLQDYESLNDADRASSLALLTGRPTYAILLLDAIEAGTFPRDQLNALHLRQLRNLNNADVDARTARIWMSGDSAPPDAASTIARLRKTYEEAPLWAFDSTNGQRHYEQLCASCHVMNGAGGRLGPDLTTAWRNGLDYFLENVVDPNGVVGTDFQLNLVTTRDGAVISGMIERETDTALVVRTMTETVSVPLADVSSLQVLPQSLMPPGLLEPLTDEQYVELMKYLLQRK